MNNQKKSNNHCCRRTFIKNCLAASAGIAIISTGNNLFASLPDDEYPWISYCGYHCDTCNGCTRCKINTGGNCPVKRCAIDTKKLSLCAFCEDLCVCTKLHDDHRENSIELRKELLGEEVCSENPISTIDINNNSNEFLIYPNPVTDYLKIENIKNSRYQYEIINLQGKIIKKGIIYKSSNEIKLAKIKSGNYILRILNHEIEVFTGKIVKY